MVDAEKSRVEIQNEGTDTLKSPGSQVVQRKKREMPRPRKRAIDEGLERMDKEKRVWTRMVDEEERIRKSTSDGRSGVTR